MLDGLFRDATTSRYAQRLTEDRDRPSGALVLTLLLGTVFAVATFVVGLSSGDVRVTTASLVILLCMLLGAFWRDRRNSMPVFFFTLCFSLFLVGRQISSLAISEPRQYGVLETGASTATQLNAVHLLLFVTLLSLTAGWFIARTTSKEVRPPTAAARTYDDAVRRASVAILIVATPAKLYAIWLATQAVQSAGFFDGRLVSASAPLPVRTFEELFAFAVLAYLAARPKLRPALLVCVLYVGVGALTLQTLSRSEFILSLIIAILYLYYRQVTLGEKIFTVGRVAALAAFAPFILTAMNQLAAQRGRGSETGNGVLGSSLEFIYSQGVSIKVVVFTTDMQQRLDMDRVYSLGPLTETFLNFKALIFGADQLSGQTATRAIEGHQLSHAISYAIAPVDYLNGVGYGSSFVAELWTDFGIPGIVGGSMIYGILLVRSQALLGKGFLASFITLLLLRGVMFTPRASYVYPISELLSPASILAFVILASLVAVLQLGRKRVGMAPALHPRP